jgi:hypothetical protein
LTIRLGGNSIGAFDEGAGLRAVPLRPMRLGQQPQADLVLGREQHRLFELPEQHRLFDLLERIIEPSQPQVGLPQTVAPMGTPGWSEHAHVATP